MLRKFVRLPHPRQMLLLEAALRLVFAQLLTRLVSGRHLTRYLGLRSAAASRAEPQESMRVAHEVRWAVAAAAHYLPTKPSCLPQALAARWMLKRRKVKSTLFLGVARQDGPTAHAWVRVGDAIVSGECAAETHAVVASFS